ncbi:hypothetical protein CSB69_1145 [Morganella morganii]|nr:hypothetical protein CSB69_1145 [Morganella morganii]
MICGTKAIVCADEMLFFIAEYNHSFIYFNLSLSAFFL